MTNLDASSAADIMETHLRAVDADLSVAEAVEIGREERLRTLVPEADGHLLGFVDMAPLERDLGRNRELGQELIGNLARTEFRTCRTGDRRQLLRRLLAAERVDRLIVVDDRGDVVGVVRRADLA